MCLIFVHIVFKANFFLGAQVLIKEIFLSSRRQHTNVLEWLEKSTLLQCGGERGDSLICHVEML